MGDNMAMEGYQWDGSLVLGVTVSYQKRLRKLDMCMNRTGCIHTVEM